jgi:DinB superfamily
MDRDTLLAMTDFSRARLLAVLDTIEKNGAHVEKALAWRPGPGRAHIAWQAMHCAATHDKYLNVNVRAGQPNDAALVAGYGGGSAPSDESIPSLATIRSTLAKEFEQFRQFIAGLTPVESKRKLTSGRTVEESVLLLAWHEAHHQGQIHLTWNLYKQAYGVM